MRIKLTRDILEQNLSLLSVLAPHSMLFWIKLRNVTNNLTNIRWLQVFISETSVGEWNRCGTRWQSRWAVTLSAVAAAGGRRKTVGTKMWGKIDTPERSRGLSSLTAVISKKQQLGAGCQWLPQSQAGPFIPVSGLCRIQVIRSCRTNHVTPSLSTCWHNCTVKWTFPYKQGIYTLDYHTAG